VGSAAFQKAVGKTNIPPANIKSCFALFCCVLRCFEQTCAILPTGQSFGLAGYLNAKKKDIHYGYQTKTSNVRTLAIIDTFRL
jgi:hypothetical protein